jgi:hypothetical protein
MRTVRVWSAAAVVLAAWSSTAGGEVVTRNTIGRGWFNDVGDHTANNGNYFVGNRASASVPRQFRNFFVVDLSGVTAPIVSARMLLWNPLGGFASPQGTEVFRLFDVSTPIAELTADQVGRPEIYADLGSGSIMGTYTATAESNGTVVSVDFDVLGLASLNAARGGLWVAGGAITTINGAVGRTDEFLFGGTLGRPDDGQTRLEFTVPGPGAGVLVIAGMVAQVRRRR